MTLGDSGFGSSEVCVCVCACARVCTCAQGVQGGGVRVECGQSLESHLYK